ncbi:MAG TPA: hypothetical protein VN696_06065 [Pyrinomonadaceae bacterium]|nr:hypothetical protein [Pyrinomonadaceae bacterium]
MTIPGFFVYLALAAWLATFLGLFHSLAFSERRTTDLGCQMEILDNYHSPE